MHCSFRSVVIKDSFFQCPNRYTVTLMFNFFLTVQLVHREGQLECSICCDVVKIKGVIIVLGWGGGDMEGCYILETVPQSRSPNSFIEVVLFRGVRFYRIRQPFSMLSSPTTTTR